MIDKRLHRQLLELKQLGIDRPIDSPNQRTMWITLGDHDYEFDENGYTGRYRSVGSIILIETLPEFNDLAVETR